jgi:MoaA/NifB/PqqE/SkfB family radical SAM enzyme
LEFIVTHKCSSKCKHCSNISDDNKSVIDIAKAEKAIHLVSKKFNINSIMTFGGEPLLYPDIIFAINRLARKKEIPARVTHQTLTDE